MGAAHAQMSSTRSIPCWRGMSSSRLESAFHSMFWMLPHAQGMRPYKGLRCRSRGC